MSDTTSNTPSRSRNGQTQAADDEIDLGYLLAICLDNKWLILAITLLVTVAGAAYAWLATP
jgi:tyrosine-protein kinase Etk/Wzc